MTRYVVEVHYEGGNRQLFGDPPFHNAAAATEFGEHLKRIRDTIRNRDNPPNGLLLDYYVVPLNTAVVIPKDWKADGLDPSLRWKTPANPVT